MCLSAVHVVAAQERGRYALRDATVRFQCKGPKLAVPAWGKFSAVQSAVLFDPKRPQATRGDVSVLLSSIVSEDVWWDKMFRGAAFLELEDHPKSSFFVKKVVEIQPIKPNKWSFVTIEGLFHLHGQSRDVKVPAAVRWTPADPATGKNAQLAVHASISIVWSDYEIRVPPGRTRTFTGDGADVQIHLRYEGVPRTGKKKGD